MMCEGRNEELSSSMPALSVSGNRKFAEILGERLAQRLPRSRSFRARAPRGSRPHDDPFVAAGTLTVARSITVPGAGRGGSAARGGSGAGTRGFGSGPP
jgi:hypothetical protein